MLSLRNKRILKSPIIGRVIELNRQLINCGKTAYKIIQHNYVDKILSNGSLLFIYARRLLLGKDYLKRATELCEEIEGLAYFLYAIGGFSKTAAANINILTEDILKQLNAYSNSQNHKS